MQALWLASSYYDAILHAKCIIFASSRGPRSYNKVEPVLLVTEFSSAATAVALQGIACESALRLSLVLYPFPRLTSPHKGKNKGKKNL